MKKPFSDKNLQRIMIAAIVILAIVAGYYFTAHGYEKKRNARLRHQIEKLEKIEKESMSTDELREE